MARLGISLIELGLVMVFLTLALVPVVKTIGGPQSSSGEGNVTRVVAQKSKEMLLANTLLEQALSSDFSTFNCGGTFTPQSGFPGPGANATLPASTRCVSNNYNQPLYYQWTVRNMDNTGLVMPTGNHYYTAVLNVWNTPTGGNPLLTLPSSFFWNESGMASSSMTTGIVIVQDISGSMLNGAGTTSLGDVNSGGAIVANVGSPFLRYRYADPSVAYTPPASIALNINNNAELDIVSALDVNSASTTYDDTYPKPGSTINPGPTGGNSCASSNANYSAGGSVWQNPPLFSLTSNAMRDHAKAICAASGGPNGAAWMSDMDDNMSRLEASRSSLLSFLLSIEADPELYTSTRLGFVTFASATTDRVFPLETADSGGRYNDMRRKLTWFNRVGVGAIAPPDNPNNRTNLYAGIDRAEVILNGDSSLGNRIIFVVTDGEPTVGQTSHAAFQTLATRIGNGSYPGAGGKNTTIFTLGILADDPSMPLYLNNDTASRTPGGQFFQAQTIGDVGPMFNQIKYQIQRVILLNKSSRYNVDFS